MKKTLLAVMLAAAFAPSVAMAEAGDWVVRARAVSVSPNEDSELGKYVNKNVAAVMNPSADLEVDSNVIPELDISYYVTKNIALELILALGTKHDVDVVGDGTNAVGNQKLGEVNLLPPTLTVQWHFNPDQMIDPYVGAGINYTRSLDRNLRFSSGATVGDRIHIERDSLGFALQGGVDINLKDGWLVNADVKYVQLDTDVTMKGAITGNRWTKIDDLEVNPWVFGVGIGKKF